jgi:hypothetical protein
MKATVIDLRYRMKDVLTALRRHEKVKALYRGTLRATIVPPGRSTRATIKDHPLFGVHAHVRTSVSDVMKQIRRSRYGAV